MLSIFLLYLPFACSEKDQDSAVSPPPIDTNTIDDDGDGFTEEDGDCDDEDPLTFPGVAEHEAVFACMTDNDGDGWGSDEPKFGVASGTDCDDNDPNMNNDDVDGDGLGGCEGDCDDNDAFQNLRDNDGDGYASCNGDCDDNDPLIHPGAAELESLTACMQDADQDGWGAQIPPNGIEAGTDCDDSDARLSHTDLDGDGFSSCNNDCDDNSAALYPYDMDGDGTSPCDGDCDDTDATLNRSDLDNDGFTSCVNDCNDNDATVFPNADERCDGQYNDCNSPDYDTTLPPVPERDSDGDGSVECEEDGSTWVGSSTVLGYADCDDNSPSYNQNDSDGDGYSTCDGDCDDNDEFTFPGIASLDSSTACMTDNDGDGYGAVQNCCYELVMTDNFGDGWNGGYITVYEDNISIGTYSVTESEGSTSTDSVCISDGSVFLLQYTAGLREGENSYSLYDPNGTLVYSAGPQPTIGDVYTD
ncbi:MAG: putative metal-binding motif-containing protein, partial [Myxococcota bacterium]|nr:putative metal-binding motif-containing protein [Myxococcota bacterium]